MLITTDGYKKWIHICLFCGYALSKHLILPIRKVGNVLFNDALNTFYLRLYGIGHMVKEHADSERGNRLPSLHGLLFPTSSKDVLYAPSPTDRKAFVTPVVEHWL